MKTFFDKAELISRLKEALGMSTDTALAEFLGISKSTLSNWVTRNSFDYELVFSKCELINKNWLLTGEGEMLTGSNPDDEIRRATPSTKESKKSIPLVSVEAVGGFGNMKFAIQEQDIQGLYDIPDFVSTDFMIRVKGSSMYPKYNSGDIVACRIIRESKFIQWNKVHVLATTEQGILIKRLKKSSTKGCFLAVSDNKEYEPFDIPENELNGIALVVGVVRLE